MRPQKPIETQPNSLLRKNKYFIGIPAEALFLLSGFCACLLVILETLYVPELVYWPIVLFLWLALLIFLRKKIRRDILFWEIVKFRCLSGKIIKNRRWEAI